MTRSPGCRLWFLIAALLLSPLAAGCGTRAYEQRVEKGITTLQVAMMFSGIAPEHTPIPGAPASIRMPKFIDAAAKAYTEESAEPSGQGKVAPARVQPPFMKLPGFLICYEMQGAETAENHQVPYYCYLAALPAADPAPDGKPFEEWVQAQLATVLGDKEAVWETVPCPTQAGQTVEWRKITGKGPQAFLDNQAAPKTYPGVFELYAKEVAGQRILIGWRFPKKIDKPVSETGRLVAGSIQPLEAAAEAPAAE